MPPEVKKLFISYRSNDAAKVDRIALDLSLLQHEDGTPCYQTWQDKHDLPPASPSWWEAIVDAILACDIFVFHLSNESLKSEVCLAELDYAHRLNRAVIPVVLEGEFALNPQSSKYDVPPETWKLIPDWLRDQQWIFYIETDFYNKFQAAVAGFERNWPREIPTARPVNPSDKSVRGTDHAIYATACDYAKRLAFTDAQKHFDTLARGRNADYVVLAIWWLKAITIYADLIEMDKHESPRHIFSKNWDKYQALLLESPGEIFFDPKGFAARAIRKPTSHSLMPDPFAWIEIPGGQGTLKTVNPNITLTIPPETYWISKYPITNSQFAEFMKAGGYEQKKWWTEAGWRKKEDGNWDQPEYWQSSKRDDRKMPVIHISWYESIAFCLWLSNVTGESITLPTEAQWQYAAQGSDGRTYPWGNNWDSNRCNYSSGKKSFGISSDVREYEGDGNSPFGVVDMAGNTSEWCLTDYQKGSNDIQSDTEVRVSRGGSFSSDKNELRCDARYGEAPHSRLLNSGFRIVRLG